VTESRPGETVSPEWFFFDGGPGSPRYGDDPTKHAVDHDTETFVREVLQNANDQRLSEDDPVRVRFEFRDLSGDDRDEFLSALDWDELADRLAAVSADEQTRDYDRLLSRVRDGEDLRVLTIHDHNTTGLTGGWEEDSNYAALVRDELYSSKQDETAGGSYGLGKSVLWTFSAASTVLFYSSPGHEAGVRDRPFDHRLIGRTKLPTHRLKPDGPSYQGAGWLCEPRETEEGVRPGAVNGADAQQLASELGLNRSPGRGTSMLVVGFADPTADTTPDVGEVASEFRRSAVKYFWPAMCRGDLEVKVWSAEEGSVAADVEDIPSVRPFVECYRERDVDETLTFPGNVGGVQIPFDPPPLADGTETPDGEVDLTAKLATPTDRDDLQNRVALFRGSGMVVKYLDQSRVAYSDRNFFGVLACGEGRPGEPSAGDSEVDRFLRAAEPPDHDDWRSTENLRNRYQRGYRSTLDGVFSDLRDGLRYLLARTDRRGEELSERVRSQFPIHGGISRSRGGLDADAAFEMYGDAYFEGGRWTFEGEVEPVVDDISRWSAEVSLANVGEDGTAQDTVQIAEARVENGRAEVNVDSGSAVVVGDTGERVHFEGESEPVAEGLTTGGTVGKTRLSVKAELKTGGEES
jgi:hypothetical protein